MAEIIKFPKQQNSGFDLRPEHVQQALAWEEWEHAVVILSRGKKTQITTCVKDFEQANYLVDLAKEALWKERIEEDE